MLDELHRAVSAHSREQWAAALASVNARAPGLVIDPASLEAHVRSTAAAAAMLDEVILAWGCARRDPAAITWLERSVLPSVRPALRRFGDDSVVDELVQRLRERLLLGTPPRIATYAGTAPLTAWVRVTAVRLALNERRGRTVETPLETASFEEWVGASGLRAQKDLDRVQVEAVFRNAVGALSAAERTLLRLYFVDGFTVDRIATMYGVNKSTASRRIAAARSELVSRLRTRFREELGLELEEARSLIRWVRSQVNLGLSQLLATTGSTKARNE